jgi:hypothetical protein
MKTPEQIIEQEYPELFQLSHAYFKLITHCMERYGEQFIKKPLLSNHNPGIMSDVDPGKSTLDTGR